MRRWLALCFLLAVSPVIAGDWVENTPKPAPLVTVRDRADGKVELKPDGKLLLLHVWASWCASCRPELTALAALEREARDSVNVAAISIDRLGWPIIDKTLEGVNAPSLTVYHDVNREASKLLGIIGLPTTVVVNAKGEEVARYIGAGEWNEPAMREKLRSLQGRTAE